LYTLSRVTPPKRRTPSQRAGAKKKRAAPADREREILDEDEDEDEGAPAPSAAVASPHAGAGGRSAAAVLSGAALALVLSFFANAGTTRDFLRAATGVLAFVGGAMGAADARKSAVGFAVVAALGLAIVGLGPATLDVTTGLLHRLHELVERHDVGVGLTMLGVLGLGGSIHRLGRLGPA
jgi:hypothetical protein